MAVRLVHYALLLGRLLDILLGFTVLELQRAVFGLALKFKAALLGERARGGMLLFKARRPCSRLESRRTGGSIPLSKKRSKSEKGRSVMRT